MNYKHGMKGTLIYSVWKGMKSRCLNPNRQNYFRYGGRGITVCEEWKNFINFYKDMGDKPIGMSLERIDNNLGYYKGNCKWATPKEQANNRNKRGFFNESSGV